MNIGAMFYSLNVSVHPIPSRGSFHGHILVSSNPAPRHLVREALPLAPHLYRTSLLGTRPCPRARGSRAPRGAAHLLLDVPHALPVQPWRATELEHHPGAHVVVDVEDERQRQEEEAHEHPALVDEHKLQPLHADPEKEE